MTPERLKHFNSLYRKVQDLEQALVIQRNDSASACDNFCGSRVSKQARDSVNKILEQDLETQLAAAKHAFETAGGTDPLSPDAVYLKALRDLADDIEEGRTHLHEFVQEFGIDMRCGLRVSFYAPRKAST